ncbi:hypothetical protein H7H78_17235 [Mycobacterium shinjukuense]|uniref:Uncharacterized protein n=1 Tax=Mycobacterium shinjukuense TaxID=398694 RepID=A0A7I7MJ81_9MYCO|nr:hypothetical protein [Mycobacterium shinjukuense]MCV6987091.1 hypothetical protein [Mycobacterium shinjukuense]ORB61643.1 hypothetical protein BST45_19790 [Mycobacterium shinjukuense]BBX72216.1 hypothetical protein MSHI_01220 [Mycobacterium shinjukuense]BBX73911.1 hypothetical protein MSHI_18170 [Mycobacterium shinjukuense]
MSPRLVKVTGLAPVERAVCYRSRVAATIRPWFPDAPTEVREAIVKLQTALDRDEYSGDIEAFLRVAVEPLEPADEPGELDE